MQPPIMRSAMSTLNAFSEKERDYHRYQSRQEALRVQRAVAYELEERRAAEQAALQAAEAERQAKEDARKPRRPRDKTRTPRSPRSPASRHCWRDSSSADAGETAAVAAAVAATRDAPHAAIAAAVAARRDAPHAPLAATAAAVTTFLAATGFSPVIARAYP
jgi:hypothetical protein